MTTKQKNNKRWTAFKRAFTLLTKNADALGISLSVSVDFEGMTKDISPANSDKYVKRRTSRRH